jgi:hypothetical protein
MEVWWSFAHGHSKRVAAVQLSREDALYASTCKLYVERLTLGRYCTRLLGVMLPYRSQ